jgi:hypothetical protein
MKLDRDFIPILICLMLLENLSYCGKDTSIVVPTPC